MRIAEYLFANYLEEGEKIVHVCHRHIFILIRDMWAVAFFHGLLPIFFWYFFPQFLFIYAIWVSVGLARAFFIFQDWYYDSWLLTNMGMISIEWTGYFDRTSARVEYPSIDGVSYSTKGVLQTFFNYGDVKLVTFGGPSDMLIKDAANPKRVEKKVLKYQEKFMTVKNFQDQEVLKQLLSDLVAQHVKKHGLPKNEEESSSESVKRN